MTTYDGKTYRLRAASPMPISKSGDFVLHSFMGEQQVSIINPCDDSIVSSSEFQGQGGSLVSASYTRLPYTPERFNSSIAGGVKYVEEFE
jgi:hypothetical protein